MLICFYRHFSETNVRAIDQIWYKRAVEQYEVESDSFVYSVPFDSGKFCSFCLKAVQCCTNGHLLDRSTCYLLVPWRLDEALVRKVTKIDFGGQRHLWTTLRIFTIFRLFCVGPKRQFVDHLMSNEMKLMETVFF